MKAHIGLFLATFFPFVANGAAIQVSKNVQVDVLESVPVRELWNSAVPGMAESADFVADYRIFDPEARPQDEKWIGCAMVMIGTRDLGIKPVAFRIWTTRSCKLMLTGEAHQHSVGNAKFYVDLGSGDAFRIEVSSDLVVTIDGRPVGRIED